MPGRQICKEIVTAVQSLSSGLQAGPEDLSGGSMHDVIGLWSVSRSQTWFRGQGDCLSPVLSSGIDGLADDLTVGIQLGLGDVLMPLLALVFCLAVTPLISPCLGR